MNGDDREPTILDVANQAGVSTATVSRVINNTAHINESTRTRVQQAIKALGYKPNPHLKPAKTAAPGTIALVVTDILNPFFQEIVRGVLDEAGSAYTLQLNNTSEDPAQEQALLNALTDRRIDGIIVCATRVPGPELIDIYERNHTPLVVINRRLNHPGIPCLTVDFQNGMYRATQHLLNLNHTQIAYLGGYTSIESSFARRRGIEEALAEAGLTLHPDYVVNHFPSIEGGFQAMSSLLALPPARRPTAVICYNDVIALGALHAARTFGLSVPEHISLVGFDDITMSAHSNPPLTTVSQPKYRMGRLAMQMLRQLIAGQPILGGGYTLMESPLIVRESTGVCPHKAT